MTELPINRYISQARLNHPDQVNTELYRLLLGDVFEKIVRQFGLTINLKLIYTPSRRAERLKINGESWLIYDQYLGQTFNILNRIFFNAEGEKESITYFHKYISEKTLEYGKSELGIELSNVYANGRECLRNTFYGDPKRTVFTIISEKFAIFHELSHEILESGDDSVRFFTELIDITLQESRKSHASETAESIIDAFRQSDPAAYHDAPLDEVIADTLANFDSPEGIFAREAYQIALDDQEVKEEIFCDFLACEIVLMDHAGDNKDLKDTICALYVASYHLKTIDFVDRGITGILLHGKANKDHKRHRIYRMQTMQVRNHCLRKQLLMMYEARLQDFDEVERSELVEALAVDLMKHQRRYFESIFDPASKILHFLTKPGKLRKMATKHKAALKQFASGAPEADKANICNALGSIAILKQTGWPSSAIIRFADVANFRAATT